MVSASRSAAFDILLRVERQGAYASELLHSGRYQKLSAADHALCTELVMGVLRWRSVLDTAIEDIASQPLGKLDLEVLVALRLGAYQLGWLERVPARAAIYESVELVKKARKRSAAPLVNAVLRKLPGDRQWKEQLPASLAAALREGTQPPSSEQTVWTFYTPHSGSAVGAQSWAHQFAHPAWLVERWCAEFGTAKTLAICQYDQQVPVTAIRLRTAGAEEE